MVIKSGESGDAGSIFSSLVAWATEGLGIDIPSSLKLLVAYCHRKMGTFPLGENDNLINQLPDDILCNIVSRLNTIEASRTSILSWRWRNIWTLNSVINFSCIRTLDIWKNYHDNIADRDVQRFFKAVDQCLQLYSGQKLKAFCVECCFLKDHACVLERWIQIIARLDIEKLSLGHSCSMLYGRPIVFDFSFKLIDKLSKLKTLELMFCYVETSFVSRCNSLVKLLLRDINWGRQALSDILVSCPNLEILEITSCSLPQNLKFTGPNLKLKILKLYDCFVLEKLEISELNLQVVKIKMCHKVEIVLSSVRKLQTLELVTHGMDNHFVDVQGDLPQLNYLLIQEIFKISALPSEFRVFSNVRRLCLMTRGFNPYWKRTNGEVDLWNFASVLSACPLLEILHLCVAPFCKEERNVAAWPVLRHKHLEYMELAGFSDTQNELEFAKFILTSAEVLRLLVLKARTRRFDGQQFFLEVKDDVTLPRDAQGRICTNLQKHALSMLARVEICYNDHDVDFK